MDILYTLAENYDGEELRYSLRSLENIPHNNVFIVGGCPRWVKNVNYIPTNQTGTKYKNTTANLAAACKDTRLSDDFIYFNDDFFILQPIKDPAEELNLYNGTCAHQIDLYRKNYQELKPYARGAVETCEFLRGLGIADPKCYELHIPFIFNKEKFLQMLELPEFNTINGLHAHKRTLYGNLHLTGGKHTLDVKFFLRDFFDARKYDKFLSCDDTGFSRVKPFLLSKFNKKSKYEW